MPRPKSKDELIKAAEDEFQSLFDELVTIPQAKWSEPGVCEKWSIKDLLAHLHEWHNMMIKWYTVGMKGDQPVMPAPGYTWKTVPDLNQAIFQQYKDLDLSEAISKVKASHKKIMAVIKQHTDPELFTKKKYAWTGSTSLGSYLISNTSSHYDWAHKLIKKWKKNEVA